MNIIIVNTINNSYMNDNGDTSLVIKFNSSTCKERFMRIYYYYYVRMNVCVNL